LGGFPLAVAHGSPGFSFGGGSTAAGALELITGSALLAVGVAALVRREAVVGALLVAASFAWFMPEWNSPGAGSAVVFTTGLALYVAAPPVVAHAVFARLGGRVPHWPDLDPVGVGDGGAAVRRPVGAPVL